MTIGERVVGHVTILDLGGQMIFGGAAEDLRDRLDELIGRDQLRVILNMERVPTMDSSGLGEILRAQQLLQRQGGDLRLLAAAPTVHRTLTLTHVDARLRTFETEETALESFTVAPD